MLEKELVVFTLLLFTDLNDLKTGHEIDGARRWSESMVLIGVKIELLCRKTLSGWVRAEQKRTFAFTKIKRQRSGNLSIRSIYHFGNL